ncbi:hypothetical protein G5B40_00750 [Pikeienuella piscinae]|uniref:Amino acid permease n=1 Tax=Pikeienuella piscinae TaxID=2748098 RepID=A0A7L5BWY2_9RHOB|nr:hypothetical protein [Pikeienuella piscinae]QIE54099.1 hypothetical protein G5B40_00750 [Pikeienuella piscinae]
MSFVGLVVLAATLAGAGLFLSPWMLRSELWRATVTPLASIIGSGFLVLGPILAHAFGMWATTAMAALCIAAWGFGAAIRYNIAYAEPLPEGEDVLVDRLETFSGAALAGAYIVSVAYYLNLFGAFGVSLTPFNGAFEGRALTSAMLIGLLALGWFKGFTAMEKVEMLTVAIKLAVIAGLVAGLAVYFFDRAGAGALKFSAPHLGPWASFTLCLGLIVTVQGFETARYIGGAHTAPVRIRAMRLAQGLAVVIYLVYTVFLSFSFSVDPGALSETAIIDMMAVVAPLLPFLLVAAALAAQASAAIADAGGAGGLGAELTGGRLSPKASYAALVAAGLALTWGSDIFTIISYASRAFAFYYALQATIACRLALRRDERPKAMIFGLIAALGLAAAILGAPAEGKAG